MNRGEGVSEVFAQTLLSFFTQNSPASLASHSHWQSLSKKRWHHFLRK